MSDINDLCGLKTKEDIDNWVDIWLDSHAEEIEEELRILQDYTHLEVDEEVLINAEFEIIANRIVRYLKEFCIFNDDLINDSLEAIDIKIENKFNSMSLI